MTKLLVQYYMYKLQITSTLLLVNVQDDIYLYIIDTFQSG